MSSQLDIQIAKVYSMKVFELRKMAKEFNIKLWYTMKKGELKSNIINHLKNLKNKTSKCKGLKINGNVLLKCENNILNKYCSEHEHKYRLEKPDDCCICMDNISSETEIPLECGHWIHKQCLIPTNTHICPMCRQQMKQYEIEYIFGKYNHHLVNNSNNIPVDIQFENFISNNFQNYLNQISEDIGQDIGYQIINDFDEYVYPNNVIDEPFNELSEEQIEMIVREIELSPRHNPYVNVLSNLTYIGSHRVSNFYDYVESIISEYCSRNNEYFDEYVIETITISLFGSIQDMNLLSISYNMLNIPYNSVHSYIYRINNVINYRISDIYDNITFNN